MEEESSLNEVIQDRALQDQRDKSPESLRPDQEQQSLHCSLDRVPVQDEDTTEDELQHNKSSPAPHQDQLGFQGADQNPTQTSDQVSPQDQEQARHPDPDQDPIQDQDQSLITANHEAVVESGGGVPALVITQTEESPGPAPAVAPVEPVEPQRPADLITSLISRDPSPSSGSDAADMMCSDLLSLKSDSLSLASETAVSRMSEDDDSASVAASSVISLFHRVHLDPLEKAWLRCSALGNMAAQRQLLCQESSLVMKKTALHWAAKQGHQEAVDLMLRSGADVNVRSGYTALHLASIHGHQRVVHALINTYNAKTNIRDYHGKKAAHYWSGCADVFNKPDAQTGGKFSRGRHTQRRVLPSLLLSRSRSQGQLRMELSSPPQSACHDAWDLHV